MKHLVIGSGNMGTHHAAILTDLGDAVDMVDLEFQPSRKLLAYDSVLLCTPAQTHAGMIRRLAKYRRPLFVEKPVFTKAERVDYDAISMVACNWRWCPHVADNDDSRTDRIICQYPGAVFLDLIHFVDVFWEKFGCPNILIRNGRGLKWWSATMAKGGRRFLATICPMPDNPLTTYNDRAIHKTPCSMFEEQMLSWRFFVDRGTESDNPISKAAKRTAWLLRQDRRH